MKRQLSTTCATLLLLLAAVSAWGANGNIGLFFDAGAATCQTPIACQGQVRMYVYALLQGASGIGMTGAEYSIAIGLTTAADPLYFMLETFDPLATTSGTGGVNPPDPAPRGINVAWPSCQLGDGTKVLIETIDILNAGCDPAEVRLRVVKHAVSSNQFFQCPLFTLCDDPTFTKVCLGSNLSSCKNPEPPFPPNATCSTSGEAFIQGSRNCTVGVTPSNWSSVKELYRN